MAFSKLTGKLGEVNARHLAHRATFYPVKTFIDFLANMQVDDAVRTILREGYGRVTISNTRRSLYIYKDYPRDIANNKYFIPTQLKPYNTWDRNFIDITKNFDSNVSYDNAIYAWYLNELMSCQGAQFKIAFFLHIQFVCNLNSNNLGGNVFDSFDYFDLINFFVNRSLIHFTNRMVIADAMTRYYTNYLNYNYSTDENLGRELMELFTIQNDNGKLPYTQADVNATSKVISGYVPNRLKYKNNFLPFSQIVQNRKNNADSYSGVPLSSMDVSRHYEHSKKFSSYFNNKVINGRKDLAGALYEKDQLIPMLFNAPNTAKAYANNLFHYFVGINTNGGLDKRIIDSLAESLKKNYFNLHKVLFDLFTSKEFYDLTTETGANKSIYRQGENYIGGKIKSPLEFAIIMLNQLKISPPNLKESNRTNAKDFHEFFKTFVRDFCMACGMELFNVAIDGYQFAFRQKEYDKSWVTTSSVHARTDLIKKLMNYEFFEVKKFVDTTFSNPTNADQLISEMINYFLPRPYSKGSSEYNVLKSIMLGGIKEWNWADDYKNPQIKLAIEHQLKTTLIHLLNSPDYLVL